MLKRSIIAAAIATLGACNKLTPSEVSIDAQRCWPTVREGMIIRGEASIYLNSVMAALYNPGCPSDVIVIEDSQEKLRLEYEMLVSAQNPPSRVISITFKVKVQGIVHKVSGKPTLRITRMTKEGPLEFRRLR